VEALPKPGYPGFFLQATLAGLPAAPLGPVPPSAVAGAPLIDLRLTPGALPSFMSGPMAQANFATRFGPGRQFVSAGESVIQWQSQIPSGGTILIPTASSSRSFEHMVVVREAASFIEHCQAANPNGIFVQASIHVDNSRMPGGDANHFFRSLFNYVSTATAAQMALDNLQWILAWTWNAFDTLSGGEPGVRNGPGGPLILGMPATMGDKHAEGLLFVAPGYESPDGVAIDANACWASLHSLCVQWGAADGAWMLQGAGAIHMRAAQYYCPLTLLWKKRGDVNDYPAIFMVYNYIMSLKRSWRDGTAGRSMAFQENEFALMGVIPQRLVRRGGLPQTVPLPITAPPIAALAINPTLTTRSIAVAAFPP
jgi:hypothetical protein